MPIYDYECGCGERFQKYLPISEYDEQQFCRCGKQAIKIFLSAPIFKIQKDIRYRSPIDGREITTWRQRNEDLASSGSIPLDDDVKKHINDIKKRQDEKDEREIDEYVERYVETLDSKSVERLGSELAHGADLNYTRA